MGLLDRDMINTPSDLKAVALDAGGELLLATREGLRVATNTLQLINMTLDRMARLLERIDSQELDDSFEEMLSSLSNISSSSSFTEDEKKNLSLMRVSIFEMRSREIVGNDYDAHPIKGTIDELKKKYKAKKG